MREILFRAKRTSNARWVEGCFFKDDEKNYYIRQGDTDYHVYPETLCEFTGFYDATSGESLKAIFSVCGTRKSQKISPTFLCISASLLETGLLSA